MTREEYLSIAEDIKSLMLLIATDKIHWAIDRKPEAISATVEHFGKMYKWKTSSKS